MPAKTSSPSQPRNVSSADANTKKSRKVSQTDSEKKNGGVSFEVYHSEASTFQNIGEFKKAINSYTKALDLKPNDKNCLIARGQCYMRLGDAEKSLADANETLKEDPKYIKGLLMKAESYYQMMQFEYALMFYHRGNKLRPELQQFRLGIQKSQEAIDNAIGESAGIQLKNSGDLSFFYEEQQQKQKKKANAVTYNNRSNAKSEEKQEERKCKTTCDTKTCKQLLGELYADKEYLEKLLKETESASNNSETNKAIRSLAIQGLDYLDTRTEFWQQQKPMYSRKRDKSMREKAGKGQGNDANKKSNPTQWILKNLEEIDEAQAEGQYEQSLKQANRVLRDAEKFSDDEVNNRLELVANLHSCIGNAHLETGDYDQALKHHNLDYNIGKEHNIPDAESRALDNLGRVYARMGKFHKAIEVWQKKLPTSKSALEKTWLYHEIGRCYLEMGEYDKANDFGEQSLEAAQEADDDLWQLNASVLIAQSQVKLENYQAAIDSFEKALEMAKAQKDRSAESAIRKAIDEVNRTIKKKERGASASDRGNDTDRGDETDHGNETDGGNETDRGSNHDRHSSSERHSSAESTHEEEGKVDTAEESTLEKETDEVVKNDSQDEAEVRREDSSEDVNDDKDAAERESEEKIDSDGKAESPSDKEEEAAVEKKEKVKKTVVKQETSKKDAATKDKNDSTKSQKDKKQTKGKEDNKNTTGADKTGKKKDEKKDKQDSSSKTSSTSNQGQSKKETKSTTNQDSSSSSSYVVAVKTGNFVGAGTDAKVFVMLFGEKGETEKLALETSNQLNKFELGQVDEFDLKTKNVGKIKKIRLGHDGTKFGAGWFVEDVRIYNKSRDETCLFTVHRWFDKKEDDKKIERDLEPTSVVKGTSQDYDSNEENSSKHVMKSEQKEGKHVTISEGTRGTKQDDKKDQKRTGSNSPPRHRKSSRAETDDSDVESTKTNKKKSHEKPEKKKEKDDHKMKKDSGSEGRKNDDKKPNEQKDSSSSSSSYVVAVKTGNFVGAGTDAKVFVILFGDKGETEKLALDISNQLNKFELGQVDEFDLQAKDIGKIKKIRLGHDGTKFGAGWFVEDVRIYNKSRDETAMFPVHRWFDKKEDDKKIERDLEPTSVVKGSVPVESTNEDKKDSLGKLEMKKEKDDHKVKNDTGNKEKKKDSTKTNEQGKDSSSSYVVAVKTGNFVGAGTDAKVFVMLFGEKGETEKLALETSNQLNKFELGQVDEFDLKTKDVGKIKKIRLGHDGTKFGAGWFVEDVRIYNKSRDETSSFAVHRWFDKKEDDKKIERDLEPASVVKGNVLAEIAKQDKTDKSEKPANKSQKDGHQKQTDSEKEGKKKDDKILKEQETQKKMDSSNKSEETKKDSKSNTNQSQQGKNSNVLYHVSVKTGTVRGAGTDANVFLKMFGEKGESEKMDLKDSDQKNKFEQGQTDQFKLETKDIGKIRKILIGHDGANIGAGWFLDEVVIKNASGEIYTFLFKRWFDKKEDDGKIERESEPTTPDKGSKQKDTSPKTSYVLAVKTGNFVGAGTDAHVFVTIFGEKKETGKLALDNSNNLDKFELGQTDYFNLEASDVGKIERICLGHDGTKVGAGWFVEDLRLFSKSRNETCLFTVNRWFDKKEDDKKIERELVPTSYAKGKVFPEN